MYKEDLWGFMLNDNAYNLLRNKGTGQWPSDDGLYNLGVGVAI